MQPLDLNLATRPFHNNTLHWLGYSLGAVSVIVMTFFNVNAYVDYSQRLENLSEIGVNLENKTADLQRRDGAAQRGIAKFDLGDLSTKAAKANAVIDAKAFSWTRLFNQIEGVLPYDVRMISVRPQFAFGRRGRRQSDGVPKGAVPVAVEGVARSNSALYDFERNLFDDVHFSDVKPDRTSRSPEGAELLFSLRFFYYPDGDPVLVAEAEAEASEAAAAEASAEAAATEAMEVEGGQTRPDDAEPAPEEAAGEVEVADPGEPMAAEEPAAAEDPPASSDGPTPNRVESRAAEEALDPGDRNDEPQMPPSRMPPPQMQRRADVEAEDEKDDDDRGRD